MLATRVVRSPMWDELQLLWCFWGHADISIFGTARMHALSEYENVSRLPPISPNEELDKLNVNGSHHFHSTVFKES